VPIEESVMDIVIRELHGIDEIATIFPVYTKHNPTMPEALFCARLSAMIAQGNYRCIAAFDGDRMVGVSGFWTGTFLWCGKYIEPDHVVVDIDLRSQGIGAKLLRWIEAEGMRLGCDTAKIAMMIGRDRAQSFYHRNGYSDDSLQLVKPLSAWADTEFPEFAAHRDARQRD
jgi:GNAT superfamily N-acetyltransferase